MSSEQRKLPTPIARFAGLLCGCGEPEVVWAWLLVYLEQVERRAPQEPRGGKDWLAFYVCSHVGLTEHGTSIRGAWLTDTGQTALAFLREHGEEWQTEYGDFAWIDDDGVSW